MGTSIVEAMLSRTAPVFYGDIRSHERVSAYDFNNVVVFMNPWDASFLEEH